MALAVQGNRVNELSCDGAGQKIVVPCGAFALGAQGLLCFHSSEQVEGHVLDCGEVGWRVAGPHPAFVVAEHHVHGPVQVVFDAPVIADGRPDGVRFLRQRGDVEPRLALDAAIGLPSAFDDRDAAARASRGAFAAIRHCSAIAFVACCGSTVVLRVSIRP